MKTVDMYDTIIVKVGEEIVNKLLLRERALSNRHWEKQIRFALSLHPNPATEVGKILDRMIIEAKEYEQMTGDDTD